MLQKSSRDLYVFGWFRDSGRCPKSGNFGPEWVATFKRNGGSFAPDYAHRPGASQVPDYWLKLDADSYATDSRPFISDEMKQYDFCGHRWGYSRPDHIKKLDEWASKHSRRKLKMAKPMLDEGKIKGNRFYHNKKRTISFIQLHKTKFTKFCVNLLVESKKLPVPSQDTYMYFIVQRFDPDHMKIMNFKRDYGFTQGKGRRWGVEEFRQKLLEVDEKNKRQMDAYESQDFIDDKEEA